jgi:hypothetical protein
MKNLKEKVFYRSTLTITRMSMVRYYENIKIQRNSNSDVIENLLVQIIYRNISRNFVNISLYVVTSNLRHLKVSIVRCSQIYSFKI